MASNWDQSKFDATLRQYIAVSGKEVVDVLNSKAYFVARKALWFTKKAAPKNITALRTAATESGGLLVGAMINRRLGAKSLPGLYGKDMRQAINLLIASRRRSIAFLKSGWIPAIRGLDPKAKDKHMAAPRVGGVKQIGVPKGRFKAASESSMTARIVNSAQARSDTKSALEKIGGPALNRAFDDEAASMMAYMNRKLERHAQAANAKL